jgi:hypothetical protein
MKRALIALALSVTAFAGQSAFADQIPGSQTNVANWSVGAYAKEGKFSHCAMSATYNSGITMLYSVSGNYLARRLDPSILEFFERSKRRHRGVCR